MAVYFRDEFTDTDGVALSAHTPGPISSGSPSWEYIEAAAAPYVIDNNGVIDGGTGVANPARVSQTILDDLIESNGEFARIGPVTLALTGQLHICMDELAIAASPGRITAEINNTHLVIHLFNDSGTLTRSSSSVVHSRDVTVLFELGITKDGTQIEIYSQDVGGGNRVIESLTLTAPEQSLYEDGVHRRIGISCTGTQAGGYFCGVVQTEDFVPAVVVTQTSAVNYEFNLGIVVSQTELPNFESVVPIPISQISLLDFEIGAPNVLVTKSANLDYEISVIRKRFCPEPDPSPVIITCPAPRTLKCIKTK